MKLKWIIGFLYLLTLGQLIKSGHFSISNTKVPLSKTTAALTSTFFSGKTDHSNTSVNTSNTDHISPLEDKSSEKTRLTTVNSAPHTTRQ